MTSQLKVTQDITVSCTTKTNAFSNYNPNTKQYYKPDTCKFDPSGIPCNILPSQILYNGGCTWTSLATATGTTPNCTISSVLLELPSKDDDPADYTTDIVSSIPIRNFDGKTVPNQYLFQIHDRYTFTKTLDKMDNIADSPTKKTLVAPTPPISLIDSIPACPKHGCKIIYNSSKKCHTGFIVISVDGTPRFSC